MNLLEKKMTDTLIDLKENHHAIGVKAEFEAEGTRLEEAMRLKEVATKAGLEMTIKIGGCEAIKDMYDARVLGVNVIVAPMVESAYAVKKYIQAVKLAFPEDERDDVTFLINTETFAAYQNIDEMLALPEARDLGGLVLGRVDMTGSMGLTRSDINSERLFEIADKIAEKCKQHKKIFVIGGGVAADSMGFFRRLPKGSLTKFETRKIVFGAQEAIYSNDIDEGLVKAVSFELMWLKNKRNYYGVIFKEDAQRITMLETRYNKLLHETSVKI